MWIKFSIRTTAKPAKRRSAPTPRARYSNSGMIQAAVAIHAARAKVNLASATNRPKNSRPIALRAGIESTPLGSQDRSTAAADMPDDPQAEQGGGCKPSHEPEDCEVGSRPGKAVPFSEPIRAEGRQHYTEGKFEGVFRHSGGRAVPD